ncbi:MAG: class I SAM-dependent methyltransferase [Armatimonadetes bacterium]|nr:class I SAM-dependent methyltransferase [Armatimonadota bacterium]
MKCPVCGGESWRTTITGTGFHIEECSAGCIGRTVPPPDFSPDLPEGARVENLTDGDSAHFTFANEIMDLLARFQPRGKLLDVGSGWGHMLKVAREHGYDVTGIEASPAVADLAAKAFGINAIVGFFPEVSFDASSFDVVIMNHVLEHVPDPRSVLVEADRILKPGGVIAVVVPNFDSLMRRLMSRRWCGLQPSQHIWQLSVKSVRRLTSAAGLIPVAVRHRELHYPRGPRSLPKWIVWLTVLTSARLSRMGDNVIVLAGKAG